jgi:hypothetical protein
MRVREVFYGRIKGEVIKFMYTSFLCSALKERKRWGGVVF